jgi:hypothetical protein
MVPSLLPLPSPFHQSPFPPPFFCFYALVFYFLLCFVSCFWSPSLISVAATPLLHLVDSPPHPVVTFSFILVAMGFLDLVLSKLDLFLSGLPDQRRPSPPPSPASLPPVATLLVATLPPHASVWPTRADVRASLSCACSTHAVVVSPPPMLLFAGLVFIYFCIIFVTCLNKDCPDLWIVDVNNFMALG